MSDADAQELDLRTTRPIHLAPEPSEPVLKIPKKQLADETRVKQAMAELEKVKTPTGYGSQQIINQHAAKASDKIKADGTPDRRHTNPHLFKAGDKRTREIAAKGGRKGRIPKFREILEKKLEEHAEDFIRPFVEGVALREDPKWSPSTKVNFFINQSILAEKAFDRFEGKPVQRNRNVDREDNDINTEILAGMGKDASIEVLVGIFQGLDEHIDLDNFIEGEVVDDE